MATAKQLQIRIKYAKTTIASLTKKLGAAKTRVKTLEGELKKAEAAEKKKAAKKPAKKDAGKKNPALSREKRS